MTTPIQPKISIIIPVHNDGLYLKPCIESIISQTYKNLEIIIIDDGSKDNSKQIYETYAKTDPRIKTIQQKNQGVSVARNRGLKEATGNYIQFSDADDFLDPHFCETMLNTIQKTDCDVVICKYQEVLNHKETSVALKKSTPSKTTPKTYTNIRNCFDELKNQKFNFVSSPVNKIYSRKVLQGITFPDNITMGEDLFFVSKVLLNAKKICFVDETLYHYRQHQDSLTHRITPESMLSGEKAFKELQNLLKDKISQKSMNRLVKEEYDWCNKTAREYNFKTPKEKQKQLKREQELYKKVINAKEGLSTKEKLKARLKHFALKLSK